MRLRLRSCIPCIRLKPHSLRILNNNNSFTSQYAKLFYSTFEATLTQPSPMEGQRMWPQFKKMSPYEWVARYRQVTEVMPMVSALVHEGKLGEAEETVRAIMKNRPEEWLSHFTTSTANMFIQAYAKIRNFEGVENWKRYLWGFEGKARPDIISYSILLKFHYECGNREECLRLMNGMEEDGFTISKLIEAEYFDQDSLQSIFTFMGKDIDISLFSTVNDEPLLDVSDLFPLTTTNSESNAKISTLTRRLFSDSDLNDFPEVTPVEVSSFSSFLI